MIYRYAEEEYEFDEIEETKISSHFMYRLKWKRNGIILFETTSCAFYWEKLRDWCPDFIYNENWDKHINSR